MFSLSTLFHKCLGCAEVDPWMLDFLFYTLTNHFLILWWLLWNIKWFFIIISCEPLTAHFNLVWCAAKSGMKRSWSWAVTRLVSVCQTSGTSHRSEETVASHPKHRRQEAVDGVLTCSDSLASVPRSGVNYPLFFITGSLCKTLCGGKTVWDITPLCFVRRWSASTRGWFQLDWFSLNASLMQMSPAPVQDVELARRTVKKAQLHLLLWSGGGELVLSLT